MIRDYLRLSPRFAPEDYVGPFGDNPVDARERLERKLRAALAARTVARLDPSRRHEAGAGAPGKGVLWAERRRRFGSIRKAAEHFGVAECSVRRVLAGAKPMSGALVGVTLRIVEAPPAVLAAVRARETQA